jgi:hypothetical protein
VRVATFRAMGKLEVVAIRDEAMAQLALPNVEAEMREPSRGTGKERGSRPPPPVSLLRSGF